jgi:hypothetical protein
MSGFSWWREGFIAGILAEETEDNSGQGGIESMGVCKDLQVGLESQQMSGTSGMKTTEKVMVGFVGTTLRGTATSAGLLESKLLNLERENFVDPFRETFLLCK